MKRLFLLILTLLLAVSLSGCIDAVLYSFEAEDDLSIVFTNDDEFYCYGDRSLFSDGEGAKPYLLTKPAAALDVAITDTTAVFLTANGVYACGVPADLPFDDMSTVPLSEPVRFVYDQTTAKLDHTTRYVPVDLSDAKQIVAGDDYVLVLKNDGTVYGWGSNFYGQLDPKADDVAHTGARRSTPVKIEGLEGISRIACSREYGLCAALDMDGHVWAWGNWMYGGDKVPGDVPFRLPAEKAVEITCTGTEVGILDADAKVSVASFNIATNIYYYYAEVEGLPEVFSLVSTVSTFAAKDGDGNVWTWGRNDLGQLGREVPEDKRTADYEILQTDNAPAKVEGLSNVISLSAGKNHFMAMTQNMVVYAWGDNSHGQLGADPAETPYSAAPVQAPKINANVSRA